MSAFARPEITTPRPMKFLIICCAIVGEIFITGYFYNTDSSKDPSDEMTNNTSGYLSQTVIYSIAATLLMVPLKIIMCLFLVGSTFYEDMTRSQIESIERKSATLRTVGYILGVSWLMGCCYGISMYILNFPDAALNGWLTTYSVAFFNETIVISQLKIFIKILLGYVIMRISRTRLLLTAIGLCASTIIDKIISLI